MIRQAVRESCLNNFTRVVSSLNSVTLAFLGHYPREKKKKEENMAIPYLITMFKHTNMAVLLKLLALPISIIVLCLF